MTKFRKKPVEIEAVQFGPEMSAEFRDKLCDCLDVPIMGWHIHTLEGPMHISDGDWIIRGIKGECYPCKPDIFEATYEPVKELNEEKR